MFLKTTISACLPPDRAGGEGTRPHSTRVTATAWSKSMSADYLAIATENGALEIVRLDTTGTDRFVMGFCQVCICVGDGGSLPPIWSLAWHPLSPTLATINAEGSASLWLFSPSHFGFVESLVARNIIVDENNFETKLPKYLASWAPDGTALCLASNTGRLVVVNDHGILRWTRSLATAIVTEALTWSPDASMVLVATADREICIFDAKSGVFLSAFPLVLLQDRPPAVVSADWYDGRFGYSPPDAPSLAICFDDGVVQLYKNELDDAPVLVEPQSTVFQPTRVKWNHTGTMLAIAGILPSSSSKFITAVQFYTPFGSLLSTCKLDSLEGASLDITDIAWHRGGFRLAVAVGTKTAIMALHTTAPSCIAFAELFPSVNAVTSVSAGDTSTSKREEATSSTESNSPPTAVATSTNPTTSEFGFPTAVRGERIVAYVHRTRVENEPQLVLWNAASMHVDTADTHSTSSIPGTSPRRRQWSIGRRWPNGDILNVCFLRKRGVIIVGSEVNVARESAVSTPTGTKQVKYRLSVWGGGEAAVDHRLIDIEPLFLTAVDDIIMAASREMLCIWNYGAGATAEPDTGSADDGGAISHVWQSAGGLQYLLINATDDSIACVAMAASGSITAVARRSGIVHLFKLPRLTDERKCRLAGVRRPVAISLNAPGNRFAVLDSDGRLTFYKVDDNVGGGRVFKRRMPSFVGDGDICDLKFSETDPDLLVAIATTTLYVFRDVHVIGALPLGVAAAGGGVIVRVGSTRATIADLGEIYGRAALDEPPIRPVFVDVDLVPVPKVVEHAEMAKRRKYRWHRWALSGKIGKFKTLAPSNLETVLLSTLDEDGRLPIHWAAIGGHVATLRWLLDALPDNGLEARDRYGMTPLHCACAAGNREAAAILIGKMPPNAVHLRDANSNTPLHLAAANGHTPLVSLLVGEAGAPLAATNNFGQTPLLMVAAGPFAECMRELLKYIDMSPPSTPPAPNSFPATASNSDGIHQSDPSMAKSATVPMSPSSTSAVIDQRDHNGRTPLMVAAANGNAAGVVQLLDSRADFLLRDTIEGRTALAWAAVGGHADVIRAVASHPAVLAGSPTKDTLVAMVDNHGRTPLHHAVVAGSIGSVRALLKMVSAAAVAAVLGAGREGRTPLHDAAECGYVDIVRTLLDAFSNDPTSKPANSVNAPDANGRTPLHCVAIGAPPRRHGDRVEPSNYVAVARMLIDSGAKPSERDKHGCTPAVLRASAVAMETTAAAPLDDELLALLITAERRAFDMQQVELLQSEARQRELDAAVRTKTALEEEMRRRIDELERGMSETIEGQQAALAKSAEALRRAEARAARWEGDIATLEAMGGEELADMEAKLAETLQRVRDVRWRRVVNENSRLRKMLADLGHLVPEADRNVDSAGYHTPSTAAASTQKMNGVQ